jgi:allophanate hydrolase subunit 1
MPRLESPRLNIPAGSVAVAENQTAVYPANSPAGWHVLGLCPLPLTGSNKAINFSVGDEVVFEPIDEARFIALGGDVVAVEEIAWPH